MGALGDEHLLDERETVDDDARRRAQRDAEYVAVNLGQRRKAFERHLVLGQQVKAADDGPRHRTGRSTFVHLLLLLVGGGLGRILLAAAGLVVCLAVFVLAAGAVVVVTVFAAAAAAAAVVVIVVVVVMVDAVVDSAAAFAASAGADVEDGTFGARSAPERGRNGRQSDQDGQ